MEHCAIDLGGRKSQVCIRASDGSIVHESREATVELAEFPAASAHAARRRTVATRKFSVRCRAGSTCRRCTCRVHMRGK
jgi:hypothetical protein